MSGFRIRTMEELTKKMVQYTKATTDKITDFRVGSKIRTLYEAVAMVLEQYYFHVWNTIKDSIEMALYEAFDFTPLEAEPATGDVVFYRNAPATSTITIFEGTGLLAENNIEFQTTEQGVMQPGSAEVTIPVQATEVGSIGNVLEGMVNDFVSKPMGIDGVTNPESFSTGRDPETRDEQRLRFQEYIRTRARGTAEALRFASMSAGATGVAVIESPEITIFNDDAEATVVFNNPYNTSMVFGDYVYFGTDKRTEYLYLRLLEDRDTPQGGNWEYYSDQAAWEPLSVIHDTTDEMQTSGIIQFDEQHDWVISTNYGRQKFWFRFVRDAVPMQAVVVDHGFTDPPPGFVDLYVHNVGKQAPSEFLQDIAEAIEDYRGQGITVNVRPPMVRVVDVHCEVSTDHTVPDYEAIEQVENAIDNYVDGLMMGEHLVLSELRDAILDAGNGHVVITTTLLTPTSTIYTTKGEMVALGGVTVEVA